MGLKIYCAERQSARVGDGGTMYYRKIDSELEFFNLIISITLKER
ncbi:hypothetical protein [Enterococcus sp. BWT-B8]|nr:hypothetical protein [Enterococcus sp. BWT-B8]